MTTWVLEAYDTERRTVVWRDFTTSKRKADAVRAMPKIQFTDSGHGIVFSATERKALCKGKRPAPIYDQSIAQRVLKATVKSK